MKPPPSCVIARPCRAEPCHGRCARPPAARSRLAGAARQPRARGDARWRPAPAFPDGAGASPAELAPRKHKSAARRVGRAPLVPHRAPGAQAVREICFSCGRTRPATICQAPGCGRDGRPAGTSRGAARPPQARAGSGGRRTRHAPRPHSPLTPIALALLMPPTSVACRSSSPDAPDVPTCPLPRGRARSTGRRGAAVVLRVSRKRCAPC